MDLSNADSLPIGTTKGSYTLTQGGWAPTPQVINPTGPIDYLRNNQPVEIQTPEGSAVVAQETERPFMPGPSLIQADLPQDQLAYKPNSVPVLNVNWGNIPNDFPQFKNVQKDKPKEATVVLTQKPVQPSFNNIAIVAVVAVVLLIIAKW